MTREFAHHDAAPTDSAPDVLRVPTSIYTDPALFELEKRTIFRHSGTGGAERSSFAP